MKRSLVLAFAAVATALFGGCDGGGPYRGSWGYYDPCTQFRSCDDCTPIIGCGWCSYGSKGQGVCFSDPGECRVEQFTWTWNPDGCGKLGGGADAGASSDGGADGGEPGEAGESDASAGDAPSGDASSGDASSGDEPSAD